MLIIREAGTGEFGQVKAFYDELTDGMADAEFKPGWVKGLYPTEEFLRRSIGQGELYVGVLEGRVVAAMVLNQACTEGYERVAWNVAAAPEEVSVIHALGIAPAFQGRGLARELVERAVRLSRARGRKVIRLDVLGTNLPAQKLYLSMGFRYKDTLELFYEDTGLTNYLLYEYALT